MGEYTPAIPPQSAEDLLPFLNEELVRIAQAANNQQAGFWEIQYNMPPRIKPGLIKYFDGTNADPLGTGMEGLYYYNLSGNWQYMGGGTGGGAVDSVNGQTGVVALDAADVGADPSGTAATQVSIHEAALNPHPQYQPLSEIEPVFTYDAGVVTRIDYTSGAYKLFTYDTEVLEQLDYIKGGVTVRKTFTYNPDGTLAAITQEVL